MKFDSFGRPILCMPRLRFTTDPNPGDPTPGVPPTPPEPEPEPTGFPSGTPVAEMAPEQQLAYWQHQARKHERRASSRSDYDQMKADSAELARLRAANQTDAERALEEARAEARREGENIGAERYLTDAVKARFQLLTKRTDEEVATAFAYVNAKSFTTDQGDIDGAALTAFAATFGAPAAAPQTPPTDPVRAAMERQQQNPGVTSGGSIAEMTRLRVDELQGKK